MKISILGTNGFLSNAIGKYANEQGWQLDMYGLDVPVAVRYDHFYPIDLKDKELDCDTMLKSDIIVYAIGAGIQSNLKEGTDIIYALNVEAPKTICGKLCKSGYEGVLVTFGSYFELGEADLKRPATEDDIIKANAPSPTDYVVSKRRLTQFVASYKHDFAHWHFILPTIYGPGENPLRLIPYTVDAIRKNEELHFTSGEQVRQYLYVGDVANMLNVAYLKSLPSGIYNIAGNETMSVWDIVRMIHSAFDKSISEEAFGAIQRADTGMKYLALSGDKLKNEIGNFNLTNFVDIIKLY